MRFTRGLTRSDATLIIPTSGSERIDDLLYEMVKEYAALGIHRTGTDVDRATAGWLAARLEMRGATVSRQEFSFDLFTAHTSVLLGADEIPSMPLYYQATGELSTNRVGVAEFGDGEHGSGLDAALETIIERARSAGNEALVIATRGETGDLVAINCEPVLRNRLPVILVPGRYAGALTTGPLSVTYSATLQPGLSANIIGRWGPSQDAPSLVITTPMSGWFNCAAERGTGIAVALQVGEWLARHRPQLALKLIVPSGHELGFYGAYHLAQTIAAAPGAVLHLGSCIAAVDAQMQGVVHAGGSTRDAVMDALAPMSILPVHPENHLDPGNWVGESQCWARFGMPMVSIAGIAPLFHTPGDLARQATTPELLEQAADCIARVALALADDCISSATGALPQRGL